MNLPSIRRVVQVALGMMFAVGVTACWRAPLEPVAATHPASDLAEEGYLPKVLLDDSLLEKSVQIGGRRKKRASMDSGISAAHPGHEHE